MEEEEEDSQSKLKLRKTRVSYVVDSFNVKIGVALEFDCAPWLSVKTRPLELGGLSETSVVVVIAGLCNSGRGKISLEEVLDRGGEVSGGGDCREDSEGEAERTLGTPTSVTSSIPSSR